MVRHSTIDWHAAARRTWPLAVVAAAVMVLATLGVLPVWSGLVYLVGLPPLDIFADLRMLLVLAPTWPVFVSLLVVLICVRIVLLAYLLGGITWQRLRFAALFYSAAAVPALIAAQLSYMGFAILYVRAFWVSVWITIVTFIVLAAAPWSGAARLRTSIALGLTSYKRIAALMIYLTVIAMVGAAAEQWPSLTLAAIPAAVLATAFVVVLLPHIDAVRSLLWPVPVALTGVALFLTAWGADRLFVREPEPPLREGSLMVMSGINSSSGDGAVYRLAPESFGFTCEQMYYYSYAGPGDGVEGREGSCPIRTGAPFTGEDTHQPMDLLAAHLAAQVEGLPRPITVVGHSHSAWVAWLAAATKPDLPIDRVIVLSAFPESGHGYVDAHTVGQGRIAADLLRIAAPIATEFGMVLAIDTPALQRVLGDPEGPAQIMRSRSPLPDHVRGLSIVAATDLVLLPSGWTIGAEVNACPVWNSHPTLPNSPAVAREINRFLDGEHARECTPVAANLLAAVSRPLGVPRHDQIVLRSPP